MLRIVKRFTVLLLLASGLPACATLTSGTTQALSVVTEPPGAVCTLSRDNAVIGVVNPTPGTLTISKSSRDIAVRCTRDAYSPGLATVTAQFQAMTAGNILIGGLIGLAVDASSGAMSKYPESILVALPPQRFADDDARDAYFEQQAVDTRRAFAERMTAIRGSCSADNRIDCETRIQGLSVQQEEELSRLAALRRNASIRNASTGN